MKLWHIAKLYKEMIYQDCSTVVEIRNALKGTCSTAAMEGYRAADITATALEIAGKNFLETASYGA